MTLLRVLLLWSIAIDLGASGSASITVELHADHSATVTEYFFLARGPKEFVFLSSPCGSVERVRYADSAKVRELTPTPPWTSFDLPADVDGLSYQIVAEQPGVRSCGVPLLMPKMPVDSVALTIRDPDRAVREVTLPNVARRREDLWMGTLPAVPSKVQIEWRTGEEALGAPNSLPTGLFFWNVTALVVVLVCWTFLYILWASRRAS